MTVRLVFATALAATAACGSDLRAQIRPVEVAIGSASALGQTSAIATSAMRGTTACATVATACPTYPCEGKVELAYGADCPLPLGGTASGTVSVTGTWKSADSATVRTTFVDAKAGDKNVVVTSATNLTVSRSANTTSVNYVGQNVSVRGSAALAAQSVWTVSVDNKGTADKPADDTYRVTGTQQAAGGSSTQQIVVSGVVLDPACRLNPTDGTATLQEVSGLSVNQLMVRFHATCDGKADVTPTAGAPQPVTLNFQE